MHNSSAIADYNPIHISKTERKELQETMKNCFEVLSRTASEIYGFANIKKLRDEYGRNGGEFLKDYPEALAAIRSMKNYEARIISGYIKVSYKICSSIIKSKENHSVVSFADLVQEAALAIYDAMYHYNGKTRFVTYVTWCIRNRLLDCSRRNQRLNGFTAPVIKLREKVRALLKNGMNIDNAINFIQEKEGRIDPEILERLQVSLSTPMVSRKVKPVKCDENGDKSQTEAMRLAIENTVLSKIERELIEAHLRGDNEYRSKMSKTVNPTTGNFWTKQRLSQIFLNACEKVRATYESQDKKKASAA